MKTHHKIELLAPARDLACGLSAIDHGADAVYIGGPQFSARSAAGNSLTDIEKLLTHAHQFRARVYVALNTIFDDRELAVAVALCHKLYEIGVDALIIQDVGLLESDLPPIPLHSSTQMNNRTIDKVRFLENVGFQQVVLARELSLDQIKEIRDATNVPLEFFVHGALCVSYSGQCYISEVMAGRSANRGECAQFCRHSFSLKDGHGKILEKDRYLLSLKDLNLSSHLEALVEAGISSFKIEGRLKDENYVKNVTAYYRQALDKVIDVDVTLLRASSGRCSYGFTPDPSKTFNRGTTDYFLLNHQSRPGAIESPKSTGQRLGRVQRSEKQFFFLETEEVINNGDGLCYFNATKKLVGIKVNRVDNGKIYPKDPVSISLGTIMYRNADVAFNKLLTKSKECRTIFLQLELKEVPAGLHLLVVDEDGIESETFIQVEEALARQAGMIANMAEKQLKKSGGSFFIVGKVAVNIRPENFYTAAVFNDLRRKSLARHAQTRLQRYQVTDVTIIPNNFPWPNSEVSYLDNIRNHKAEAFFRRHGIENIDRKTVRAGAVKDCALMTTKYCIKAQLQNCPKMNKQVKGVVGPLTIVDNTSEYILDFDCQKCEMTVRNLQEKE